MLKAKTRWSVMLTLVLILAALEALAAVIYLVSIPGDPKNSLILGLSAARLGLAGVLLSAAVWMGWLAYKAIRNPTRSDALLARLSRFPAPAAPLMGACLLLVFVAWAAIFTPAERFLTFGAFIERIRPHAAWLGLAGAQFGLLLALRARANQSGAAGPAERPRWRAGLVFTATFLGVGGLILLTRLGLDPDPISWNEPGIPLLAAQALGALLAALGMQLLQPRLEGMRKAWRIDLGFFLGIWLLAGLVWNLVPFPGSFFLPGPYAPDYQRYPFSDSARYDLAAQTVFIGKGLNAWNYVDKPLYSVFLLGLHLVAGQDYNLLLGLQAGLLAAFPAVVYLLGRALGSRAGGIAAALLVTFQQANAISASQTLLTANPRLMVSEVPTALLLALFCLFLVRWLENPRLNARYAWAAGGLLGLSTLVRHNPWLVLPAALLLAGWVYASQTDKGKRLRGWLGASLGFLLVFGLAVAPWMGRTYQQNGTPFYFLIPFQGSVMPNRYGTVRPTPSPAPDARLAVPAPPPAATEIQPTETESIETAPTEAQSTAVKSSEDSISLQKAVRRTFLRVKNILGFSARHTMHQLAVSPLILPLGFKNDSLKQTLSADDSIWQNDWDGGLSPGQIPLLLINLGLIGLGCGLAWQRMRWAGMAPLVAALAYFLANGLARTSGGRYLVPTDWVVLLYYALGLGWLISRAIEWLDPQPAPAQALDEPAKVKGKTRLPWLIAALFLGIGLLLPLSEVHVPLRFIAALPSKSFVKAYWTPERLEAASLTHEEVLEFIQKPGTVATAGRIMYPRFYAIDQGEADKYSAYAARPFPRLAFTLIGPRERGVILPLAKAPAAGMQALDVVLLGCAESKTSKISALVMVTLDEEMRVYQRQPAAALDCPAPEPACDDNRKCK